MATPNSVRVADPVIAESTQPPVEPSFRVMPKDADRVRWTHVYHK